MKQPVTDGKIFRGKTEMIRVVLNLTELLATRQVWEITIMQLLRTLASQPMLSYESGTIPANRLFNLTIKNK